MVWFKGRPADMFFPHEISKFPARPEALAGERRRQDGAGCHGGPSPGRTLRFVVIFEWFGDEMRLPLSI